MLTKSRQVQKAGLSIRFIFSYCLIIYCLFTIDNLWFMSCRIYHKILKYFCSIFSKPSSISLSKNGVEPFSSSCPQMVTVSLLHIWLSMALWDSTVCGIISRNLGFTSVVNASLHLTLLFFLLTAVETTEQSISVFQFFAFIAGIFKNSYASRNSSHSAVILKPLSKVMGREP